MTFIQANITLSTLLSFDLLVAIKANCKQTMQFSCFVILNISTIEALKWCLPWCSTLSCKLEETFFKIVNTVEITV